MHFHPIQGKTLDIIGAILRTQEVASVDHQQGAIHLVVEELVTNVVKYAYPDGTNDYLDVELMRDESGLTLRFRDAGVPFNPLKRESPDTSLPVEQREIGGLGIFLVIQKVDDISYDYTDGENVLTVFWHLISCPSS